MPFRNGEDMWALISPCSNRILVIFHGNNQKENICLQFQDLLYSISAHPIWEPDYESSLFCLLVTLCTNGFFFFFFFSLSSHDWRRVFPLVCKAASVLLKSLLKILNHLGNLPKSWRQSLMCRNFCVLHWPKFCCNFIVPPSACLWLLSLA